MNNFVYFSKYQNLHMDRGNRESMKTINIKINSNLKSSKTPRLIHRYKHGYDYTPQFWGLWDVRYSSGLGGGGSSRDRRRYGYVEHNTGFGLSADFYYLVDDEYVSLYFLAHRDAGGNISSSGTVATFTGYLFANDTTEQDYT